MDGKPLVADGRTCDVAAQLFDSWPVMCRAAHGCVQAEPMRKYAALKVGIKFFGDEARQWPAIRFALGDVVCACAATAGYWGHRVPVR